MKSFISFLTEEKAKSAVLLFGRMNPITSWHEENVNAVNELAKKHEPENPVFFGVGKGFEKTVTFGAHAMRFFGRAVQDGGMHGVWPHSL